MSSKRFDCGMVVTDEMKRLFSQPGFFNNYNGGERARYLYQLNSMGFNPTGLSEFGLACFVGQLEAVKKAVELGTAPDLRKTETPYKHDYASWIIFGAQRVQPRPDTNHLAVLKYLIGQGLPLNTPDIAGYTALQHIIMTDPWRKDDRVPLLKALLEGGADPNHQNRWGESALLVCMAGEDDTVGLDMLLQYGANVELADGRGYTCLRNYVACGPRVAATVDKWLKLRRGEKAPLTEKQCDHCGKNDTGASLKKCSTCLTVQYCSKECQKLAWKAHKPNCRSMKATPNVTIKPYYRGKEVGANVPRAPFERSVVHGLPTNPVPASHLRSSAAPKLSEGGKQVIVKIQASPILRMPNGEHTDLYVYTRKRDLVCSVRRRDTPEAYDELLRTIQTKGMQGQKGYFIADIKSKDEIVVKVSEILAAQPW